MSSYRRIDLREVGDVTVVRFRDRKIIEDISIQELGGELSRLVEVDGRVKILLNFSSVDYVSGAFLGKLITLDKKVKDYSGGFKFSNMIPGVYELFCVTHLDRLFSILDDEADALAAFGESAGTQKRFCTCPKCGHKIACD